MFDNLVAAHGPSGRTRARTIVVTTSVLAHLAAVAVLAVLAIWKVDKVDLDARGSRVSALTLPPRDSGGGGAPKPELVAKPKDEDKPKKVKPAVTVQPEDEVAVDQQIVTESEGATGAAAGSVPGNGTGGDGKGLDVPTGPKCAGAACLGGGTGDGDKKAKICLEGEKLIDGQCIKDKKVEVVSPAATLARTDPPLLVRTEPLGDYGSQTELRTQISDSKPILDDGAEDASLRGMKRVAMPFAPEACP